MIDSEENSNLARLPTEIWERVFAHLLLNDRKNIRSTCHYFYEICNNFRVQQFEKIALHGNRNTCAALHSLSKNERKRWNIQFTVVDLNDVSFLEFFEVQGINVYTLGFNNCQLGPRIFADLIAPCKHLQALEIPFIADINTCKNLFDDFRLLLHNGIIFKDVTHLDLHIPAVSSGQVNYCITNCDFIGIFDIFPNIKFLNLRINIDQYFDNSNEQAETQTDYLHLNISYSTVYNQLFKIRQKLTSLLLHFNYNIDTFGQCLSVQALHKIADIKFENLRGYYSLNWINLWDESINNPFSKLKNLTVLVCTMNLSVNNLTFLKLLLKTITRLKWLQMKIEGALSVDRELFELLIKSQLEMLTMSPHASHYGKISIYHQLTSFIPVQPLDIVSISSTLSPNYKMKRLHAYISDHKLLLLFFTFFKNLEMFSIINLQNNILSNILKIPTKLRSLTLFNYNRFPFKPCRRIKLRTLIKWLKNCDLSSNRQFDNITDLHIVEKVSANVSVFLLDNFTFPNLKSLRIQVDCSALNISWKKNNFELLWKAIQKCTQLQSIDILTNAKVSLQQWLDLFNALPNLHHFVLSADNPKPFPSTQFEYFFKTYPSLRSICILQNRGGPYLPDFFGVLLYYIDIITKLVMHKNLNNDQFNQFPHNFFRSLPGAMYYY